MPTEEITIEDLVNWYCEEYGIVLWKDVPGFEGYYQASNVGSMVRSVDRYVNSKHNSVRLVRGKVLKPHLDKDGYPRLSLKVAQKSFMKHVYTLVTQAWVPNPKHYTTINHIDEDKTNCNAANLEWCDVSYNNSYGSRLRKVSQYTQDGVLLKTYPSITDASKQTGLSCQAICSCTKGKLKTAGGYKWKREP